MPGRSTQGSPPSEHQGTLGTCQICGSAIPPRYTIPAVRRWGSDSDFHVYWCRNCDAGFLLPRPSRELLESFYSSQYFSDYGKAIAIEQSVLDRLRVHLAWRFDRSDLLDSNLLEAITNSRSAKICDLGCGNGVLLAKLRAHGFQVVGIEPSPFARKEVESKGIKVYEGTAESLPDSISESPFDLVVMTHVLEHCLDLQRTVRNALELVRAGGHVVIEVPNCASFQFEIRGPAWFHFDVGRHVNYFTPRALATLIELHGAGAKAVRYYYRKYVEHFTPEAISHEMSLWDRSHIEEISSNLAGIRRPSKLENWMSLLGSFALKPMRKYEAVGIVARKG
jgi:2-polyprenyl-3-methyl-5-hydroxy-6-metoxy-1,4-benzoquinol methylase